MAVAMLGGIACGPVDEDTVSSDELYTRDNPGRNLIPKHTVEDYRPVRGLRVDEQGGRHVILRELTHDGAPSYVVVDDATLEMQVVDATEVNDGMHKATDDEVRGFRYPAMLEHTRSAVLCQVNHERSAASGVQFALTIDMCQSRRDWDEALYTRLVALSEIRGEPTRVGVALTGLWAQRHTQELAQLIAWQQDGKLDITWINHSYSHQLSKHADGSYHFLTETSVDLTKGVLDLEQLLVEQGVRPSVLFRFPGLTHDARTLAELNDLSVFPLDANGWLAKGESLSDGSVVLLHGNGNEPPGVRMFLDWADAHADELASGAIQLVDPVDALPASTTDVATCTP
jgi:hypothetical protein